MGGFVYRGLRGWTGAASGWELGFVTLAVVGEQGEGFLFGEVLGTRRKEGDRFFRFNGRTLRGRRVRKKDLGMIATTYGYVYVAQIAMGADQAQTLKAIREAEAYPGPSLIIAYAPCINHGLKAGMGKSQAEEAKAVECGYWHLWRYNPELEAEGKNPFQLDSKEPQWDKFQDYLKGEVRFASVAKQFPKEADELFAAAQENAQWRYKSYLRMLGTAW